MSISYAVCLSCLIMFLLNYTLESLHNISDPSNSVYQRDKWASRSRNCVLGEALRKSSNKKKFIYAKYINKRLFSEKIQNSSFISQTKQFFDIFVGICMQFSI